MCVLIKMNLIGTNKVLMESQDRNYEDRYSMKSIEKIFQSEEKEFSFLLLAYVKLCSLTFEINKDHYSVILSNGDYNNATMAIDIIQLLLLTYF